MPLMCLCIHLDVFNWVTEFNKKQIKTHTWNNWNS